MKRKRPDAPGMTIVFHETSLPIPALTMTPIISRTRLTIFVERKLRKIPSSRRLSMILSDI